MLQIILIFLTASGLIGCENGSRSVTAKPKRPAPSTTLPTPPEPGPKAPHYTVENRTRIICQPQVLANSSFLSSLTNVSGESFHPEMLTFFEGETPIRTIETFHWLYGDGLTGEVLFSARPSAGSKANIYWGQVDLISRKGLVKQISTSDAFPYQLTDFAQRLWQKPSLIGFHRESAYLLLPKETHFVLQDLFSQETLGSINLPPTSNWNPTLDSEGHQVSFQSINSTGYVRLKLVEILSGTVKAIPAATEKADQILPEFIGGNLFWMELEQNRVRLYRSELHENILLTNLMFEKEFSNVSFVAWGSHKEDVYVFVTQETNKDGQLSQGTLNVFKLSLTNSKKMIEKKYPYPKRLIGQTATSRPALSQIKWSPWTQDLIAGLQTGLVSFSINKEQWKFHSVEPGPLCRDIEVGPEFIIQENL